MKREFFALIVVILLLVVFPASLFAYQAWRTNSAEAAGVRVIDIVGRVPANGGWDPGAIRVKLGERVRLRIASPDVLHGFEIPALGIKVDEILPGYVEEVEFTANQVGRFPFACTRWCSVDHWRMRGTIEVTDPSNPSPAVAAAAPPLYQQLKVDIDALHPAQNVPAQKPSAVRGVALNLSVTEDLRTQSPSDVFGKLRAGAAFEAYSDMQLWDAIASAYQNAAGPDAIARGQALFAQDCAACHGEQGKGNGTAGRDLPGLAAMLRDSAAGSHTGDSMSETLKRGPADFTDASKMLGASDVYLQGKLLRGGMGTGMPEWGSLYTEQQMWDVIAYLRSFTLDYGTR